MTKNPLWFLFIFFSAIACQDRPTFPLTPSINLNEFYFKEIQDLSLDSLIIKIKFEDGDGDLGLNADEIQYPYQLMDPVTNLKGDTLRYGDPGAPEEYDCMNYEIIRKETSVNGSLVVTADTIYVDRNENHFNFFLTFLIEQDDGSFEAYNPALERNCAPPYYGRYFILNPPLPLDIRPLTGELQYSLVSGFRLLFRNEIIKLKIQIQDRKLNKSNILVTDEFLINNIIRPPD
jgi:hypothetical protein